jgi:type IV pilus biogenesis protein CpaD/CtpE
MKKHALLLLILAPIAACTSPQAPGNDFVGAWHDSENPKDTIVIAKSENGFMVTQSRAGMLMSGEPLVRKLPARYENQSLIAMPLAPLVYDKETDTISLGSSQYMRSK